MASTVQVLFFATAKEATGRRTVSVAIPSSGVTVRQLLAELISRYPNIDAILRSSRFVRNGTYLESRTTRIHPGDEFAVHPPYTGG